MTDARQALGDILTLPFARPRSQDFLNIRLPLLRIDMIFWRSRQTITLILTQSARREFLCLASTFRRNFPSHHRLSVSSSASASARPRSERHREVIAIGSTCRSSQPTDMCSLKPRPETSVLESVALNLRASHRPRTLISEQRGALVRQSGTLARGSKSLSREFTRFPRRSVPDAPASIISAVVVTGSGELLSARRCRLRLILRALDAV